MLALGSAAVKRSGVARGEGHGFAQRACRQGVVRRASSGGDAAVVRPLSSTSPALLTTGTSSVTTCVTSGCPVCRCWYHAAHHAALERSEPRLASVGGNTPVPPTCADDAPRSLKPRGLLLMSRQVKMVLATPREGRCLSQEAT